MLRFLVYRGDISFLTIGFRSLSVDKMKLAALLHMHDYSAYKHRYSNLVTSRGIVTAALTFYKLKCDLL